MLIVGLTGGISSGKSTVSHWFVEKGITVLDADAIVKDLQAPHSVLLGQLADAFGSQILNTDGSLNRSELGKLIFTNEGAKEKINEIIHPLVKAVLLQGINKAKQAGESFIILDVPLLYESGFDELVDLTVVVYVQRDTQIERLMNRDQIDKGYATQKVESQLSLDEKRHRANRIIDNNGTLQDLRVNFEIFYEQLSQQIT
ncbi:MAG: dephospho-CoA kinase [Turicibacter sp.]